MRKNGFVALLTLLFVFFGSDAISPAQESTATEKTAATRYEAFDVLAEDEIVFPIAENLNLILAPNETGLVVLRLDYPLPKNATPDSFNRRPRRRIQDVYPLTRIGKIVVPEKVDGRKVTEIGARAFANAESVARIELPDSILKIGNGAFERCRSLVSVSLPNELTTLGARAFYGCYNLEEIVMPPKVAVIEENTFDGCCCLKSIVFGDSLLIVKAHAFRSCSLLGKVVLSESVKEIDDSAFEDCIRLTSINLPESRETRPKIPLTYIAPTDVKEASVPDSVRVINDFSFHSFRLKKIFLGKDVEKIVPAAFVNVPNLKSVSVDSENRFFQTSNNLLATKDGTRLVVAFVDKGDRVKLPQTLEKIDDCAFANVEPSIVIIPASVFEIGEFAFHDRKALVFSSLAIKSPLTIIVDEANPNYKSVDGALLSNDGERYIQAPLGRKEEYNIPGSVKTLV